MYRLIFLTICLVTRITADSSHIEQECPSTFGNIIQLKIPPCGSDSCVCNNYPFSAEQSTTQKSIREDYQLISGIGAYKLHPESLMWNDARLACDSEGGHLAVVNSEEESQALKAIIAAKQSQTNVSLDSVLIGFHDLFKEGQYVTINGDSLEKTGFSRFTENQPDNGGGEENCGSISIDGQLNDVRCYIPFPFLCELPLNG